MLRLGCVNYALTSRVDRNGKQVISTRCEHSSSKLFGEEDPSRELFSALHERS